MSVPEPIAKPTSAFTRDGLSFIPSPINATFLPSAWSFDTSFSLSAGITSDITLSIFNLFPIVFATIELSPVNITTSIFFFLSSSIAL